MLSNSDLEKWQKAIQGIEVGQKDLSPEESTAFQTLKTLLSNGNFESDESVGNIKIIKDSLKQHDKHRLLKVHLTSFVALCEQSFTKKSASFVQPQAPAPVFVQPPEIKLQSQSAMPPPPPPFITSPTFGDIPGEDINDWQKAIQGIEAEKNNLSSAEWSAFEKLRDNCRKGNFVSNECIDSINVLRNAMPSHSGHRMLQKVHLPKFIALCEKYFKKEAVPFTASPNTNAQNNVPTFQPPVFQPPVNQEIKQPEPEKPKEKPIEKPVIAEPVLPPPLIIPPVVPPVSEGNKNPKKSNKQLIFIIVAAALLIGGWQIYKNWDTVKNWEPISKLLNHGEKSVAVESAYIHPLVGKWKGILNKESATLEFLSIDTVSNNVTAQIYFSENRPDTLKLNGKIDRYSIELKDDSAIYLGVLKTDSSFYSGICNNKNTGVSSNFSFLNPKIAIDIPEKAIESTDSAIAAEPVKDSTVIAPVTHESEKRVSNNPPQTVTEPVQTLPVTGKTYSFKTYSFGRYEGSALNGYPEGNGKMTYTRRVQIAKQDTNVPPHIAESGDYFIGSWGNGDIVSGTLYDSAGNIKEKIMAPKRFNLYNISND